MNTHASHRLIKHGAIVMIFSLLAGVMFTYALIGGVSVPPTSLFWEMDIPGSVDGWRRFHTGAMMNGLMAIGLGCAIRFVRLEGNSAAIVSWGTLVAIYGNTFFYLFGLMAPNRGLSVGDNQLGEGTIEGMFAYFPAVAGMLTLFVALFVFVFKAKPAD